MIRTIDLAYLGDHGCIASYLVTAPRGPVLVETGPANTLAELQASLHEHGLEFGDVRHAIVTHIHFDHAGAAGHLARHGTHIYVHEFGARHLIDPTRLVDSATRIYGDRMQALWGSIVPVPENQVTPIYDGDVLEVAGLRLRAIETPGHARHHHAFAMDTPEGRVAFTGDAAACFVAEAPGFISLPTPPPEFDLEAWEWSLERLESEAFDRIYPTHFGRVDDPATHFVRLRSALRAHTAFVEELKEQGLEDSAIMARYRVWFIEQAESQGLPEEKMPFYVTRTLSSMNVSGILRYLARRAERVQR